MADNIKGIAQIAYFEGAVWGFLWGVGAALILSVFLAIPAKSAVICTTSSGVTFCYDTNTDKSATAITSGSMTIITTPED